MKIDIEGLLYKHGPMASSKLKKLLIERGLSEEAARQRMSRGGENIMRFTHFYLPKREAFLYLAKDFNSRKFWNALLTAHSEAHSVYANTYFALRAYQGVIPAYLLAKVSGAPIKLTKHVPVRLLEEQMVKGELLRRENDEEHGAYLVSHVHLHEGVNTPRDVRGQLLVEEILIKGVSDWLRKNSMVSFNKVQVRNQEKMPDFSHHNWDITAPSYIHPLASVANRKTQNGFVVADIVYANITTEGIQAFMAKVNRCRSLRNSRPFMAMLIADSFDKETMNQARQAGIMLTTVSNFLGTDIAHLMDSLLSTLNRAARIAAANPGKINELLKGLNRIEGAAINLRGVMFEMLVCHVVLKTQNVSTVDMNKVVTYKNESAEIDVVGFRHEAEIKCYECKGYEVRRLITAEMIDKWIERVQRIRKFYQNSDVYRDRKLTFEYWTSSTYTPEAEEKLKAFRDKNNRINVGWKDGQQILEIARKDRLTTITETLNEHYFKHPLSKEWPDETDVGSGN
ncbi:hypothetical protein [Pantoea ananatis]|uniref:hypothetical protein n=1 Tax=Pantoea ananas TaxID=553 RepID=UPI001C8A6A41|nr:hypothetical protein [Pantoea ananatis]QZE31426.1 hypothetical protein K4732_20970 [Pantoea ananatis]